MADQSKGGISWTNQTWNPVTGCSRISEGCRNCYAERVSHQYKFTTKPWSIQNAAENVVLHHDRLTQPLRWRKPQMVFVNSMSDLFHELVPFEFIDRVFAIMGGARQHTFQVLTKRPARMLEYMDAGREEAVEQAAERLCAANGWCHLDPDAWPLPNVILGVSAERQREADERIPILLQVPAAMRMLSLEPLLGPIDLKMIPSITGTWWNDFMDPRGMIHAMGWIIVGGESGPGARSMHPDWVRSLRNDAEWAEAPFHFKQWGEFNEHGVRVGKKAAGRTLDGRTWDEFPQMPVQSVAVAEGSLF